MRNAIANNLLLLIVFLLPWQTRYIFSIQEIAGAPSEFGVLSVYVVEVLVMVAYMLRGGILTSPEMRNLIRAGYFFLAVSFFSLSFSDFFLPGAALLIHVFAAYIFFLLLIDSRTDFFGALHAFLFGLIGPAVLGIAQFFLGESPASTFLGIAVRNAQTLGDSVVALESVRVLRAYGSFGHPNIFGGYLLVAILLMFFLAYRSFKKKQSFWLLFSSALFSFVLMITFSRSAWVGLFVGISFFLLVSFLRKEKFRKHIRSVIVVLLLTILGSAVVLNPYVGARFMPTSSSADHSVEERVSQYEFIDEIILAKPLLGHGPGSYSFVSEVVDFGKSVYDYQPIHNVLLLLLAEVGVVGFGFLFWMLMEIDTFNKKGTKSFIGRLSLSIGISVLVLTLFDHYLWTQWSGLALCAFVFFLLVGLPREDESMT